MRRCAWRCHCRANRAPMWIKRSAGVWYLNTGVTVVGTHTPERSVHIAGRTFLPASCSVRAQGVESTTSVSVPTARYGPKGGSRHVFDRRMIARRHRSPGQDGP